MPELASAACCHFHVFKEICTQHQDRLSGAGIVVNMQSIWRCHGKAGQPCHNDTVVLTLLQPLSFFPLHNTECLANHDGSGKVLPNSQIIQHLTASVDLKLFHI